MGKASVVAAEAEIAVIGLVEAIFEGDRGLGGLLASRVAEAMERYKGGREETPES